MDDVLDLDRYPIDRPDSSEMRQLVARCQAELREQGMFDLEGLVRPAVITRAATEVKPLSETVAYTHTRTHNIYFQERVPGVAPDHQALRKFETTHHTLCADQLAGTIIHAIYEWTPLADFLARVLEKSHLYLMSDKLARVNVMHYAAGETLNWHFDRSAYTTTLLIQAAESGGEFEYRSSLRSDADPNYEGVARLLRGEDPGTRIRPLQAGTLNVFAGRNTAHRVTPVRGRTDRLVAVFSYYDRPDVSFSDAERVGFYGRAA